MPDEYPRREYPNPPIAEALCQVTFARPLAWSVATPGLLWERLRDDYPTEPEAQDQISASVQTGDDNPNVALNRGEQRFIYRDEERQRLVVANRTFISANSLPPHEGWPALRGRLEAAIRALGDTVTLQPVERVGLRYINRVVVPGPEINTDDYFNIGIRTARQGDAPFQSFMHRVESILDPTTIIMSTFATLKPADDTNIPFLLDFDLMRVGLDTTDLAEILKAADELHYAEHQEFESAITDETRKLFT